MYHTAYGVSKEIIHKVSAACLQRCRSPIQQGIFPVLNWGSCVRFSKNTLRNHALKRIDMITEMIIIAPGGIVMKKRLQRLYMSFLVVSLFSAACTTSYKAKPLPFKTPTAFPNATEVSGAIVAAKAFAEPKEANEAFGFDIRGAGMLPVQVVFDNQGSNFLEINAAQTFLEDNEGNLWPILARNLAYERATKYAQTKEIFKKGAYTGFLGAAAGTIIGAAVGIVGGGNIATAAGKGAAAGAAAGATLGGAGAYGSNDARRAIIDDLREKSLQTKAIEPKALAYGFLFFPGEALSAKQLRLHVLEQDTGTAHILLLNF